MAKREKPSRLGGKPGTFDPGLSIVSAIVATVKHYLPSFAADKTINHGHKMAVFDAIDKEVGLEDDESAWLTQFLEKIPPNSDWPEYTTMLKLLARAAIDGLSGLEPPERINLRLVLATVKTTDSAGDTPDVIDADIEWPKAGRTPRQAAMWFLEQYGTSPISLASSHHLKLVEVMLDNPHTAGMVQGAVAMRYEIRFDRSNPDLTYNTWALEGWHQARLKNRSKI